MAGGVDYFSHCSSTGEHDLYEGEQPRQDIGYLTDLISRRAAQYVRGRAAEGQKFFLSLSLGLLHLGWVS